MRWLVLWNELFVVLSDPDSEWEFCGIFKVVLSKSYTESFSAASVHSRRMQEDNKKLFKEVTLHIKPISDQWKISESSVRRVSDLTYLTFFNCAKLRKAQELVQRINPVLRHLHQRTTTAMEQSKQHLEIRDRAVEERNMVRSLPLKSTAFCYFIYSYLEQCMSNYKKEHRDRLKPYDSRFRLIWWILCIDQ